MSCSACVVCNVQRADSFHHCLGIPSEFTIARWPVSHKHESTAAELAKIVPTHVVNYLPAFDLTGQVIKPAEYEHQLRGAVVFIQ